MRQDYPEYQRRDTEVIAIGTSSPSSFERFWELEAMPFPGIPDPNRRVLRPLGQEFKWRRLGRMPAILIVDKSGIVRWGHYGDSASDIPDDERVLSVLDTVIGKDA